MQLNLKQPTRTSILLLGILFPMAFDYKGETGGGAIIVGIFAISFCAACLFLREYWSSLDLALAEKLVGVATVLPWAASLIPLLLGTVELRPFTHTVVPYVLLTLGYFVGLAIYKAGLFSRFLGIVFVCAFVSVTFNLFRGWAENVEPMSFENVRYHIISQYSYALFLVAGYQILCRQRIAFKYVAALDVIVAVMFLALTRSYVIALLAGLVFMVLPTAQLADGKSSRRKKAHSLMVPSLSVVLVIAFVAAFQPTTMVGWQGVMARSLHFGDAFHPLASESTLRTEQSLDVSAIERLAEISSQLSLLDSDWTSMVFGRGIGSPYGLAAGYYDFLGSIPTEWNKQFTFVGHNFWVYSIFANGIVVGLVLPLCLLFLLVRGVVLVRGSRFASVKAHERAAAVISLAYLGIILASTIGANVLGSRAGTLMFGIFLGVLVGWMSEWSRSNSASRPALEA
ncbi:MAG TPA: hypothetical protein VIU46_00975 [Gallionellaceae bacterium]